MQAGGTDERTTQSYCTPQLLQQPLYPTPLSSFLSCHELTFCSAIASLLNTSFFVCLKFISWLFASLKATMKFLQPILSLAGLTALPTSPNIADSSVPSLPSDHPASIQFSAWLSAFNTADRETILAYHTDLRFPLSVLGDVEIVDHEVGFARGTGGFDVAMVQSSSDPSFVVVVLREKKGWGGRHTHVRANMTVDTSQPTYPVTKFTINPCVIPIELIPKDDPRRPQFEKALGPLDYERRRAVVDGLSDVLRKQCINQTLGEEIIAALDTHLEKGDYEGIDNSEEFSKRLTQDVQESGHDKHMFISFMEPLPERNETDGDDKPSSLLEPFRSINFGFGNTSFDTTSVPGRLIATLPINAFLSFDSNRTSDWEEIRAAIGDRVSSVAEADALIVDLRENGGGNPNTVAFILSYLLDDGPIHLLDMVDRNGTVERSHSTVAVDELPAGSKRFGGTKPLFVLTTNRTIFGGEDMAYGLQAFQRAQAIIGEGNDATAGAANPITQPRFIAEEIFGEKWWLVAVPNLKPVHAITGSNWEGIGVKSDVVAGKGEWEEEKEAKEVGRKLAVRLLQRDKEL